MAFTCNSNENNVLSLPTADVSRFIYIYKITLRNTMLEASNDTRNKKISISCYLPNNYLFARGIGQQTNYTIVLQSLNKTSSNYAKVIVLKIVNQIVFLRRGGKKNKRS